MRKVHLIRHGQTDWNEERRVQGQSESVLTPLGRKQAAELRSSLAGHPIQRVFCSSSRRTRQTAEILFEGSDTAIEYCDSLREIHLGNWEGSLHAEIRQREPQAFNWFWQEPHHFVLEGAETFEEVQQRGLAKFQHIIEQDSCDEVAIVSHGVLIKSILCHLESRHLSRLWDPPVMHNCAHSIVCIEDDGALHITQYAGETWGNIKRSGRVT